MLLKPLQEWSCTPNARQSLWTGAGLLLSMQGRVAVAQSPPTAEHQCMDQVVLLCTILLAPGLLCMDHRLHFMMVPLFLCVFYQYNSQMCSGSRTPHYGSMTPSHGEDGSRTPGRSGAWDPTVSNTPAQPGNFDRYGNGKIRYKLSS